MILTYELVCILWEAHLSFLIQKFAIELSIDKIFSKNGDFKSASCKAERFDTDYRMDKFGHELNLKHEFSESSLPD